MFKLRPSENSEGFYFFRMHLVVSGATTKYLFDLRKIPGRGGLLAWVLFYIEILLTFYKKIKGKK